MVNALGQAVIKNMLETEQGTECVVCGGKAHRKSQVWLHNYGVRRRHYVPMCERCIKLEAKGEL